MPLAPEIIIKEIQDLYQEDNLPWIVGYSGGKDSTASLQLIWKALEGLPDAKRTKMVHVISTDTLVENPVIAAWVEVSLGQMKVQAMAQRLPIRPERLTPNLENRFWVNLIGKGYPAPRPKFRWCTDRLKISASTKYIQDLSEANGEAILVLGQRRGESQARDKVLDQYSSSTRQRLSRNKDPKLSRVWVYLPIETWSSDDVWEYIIETPNPWGVSNQDLFNIYRGATPDSECPIVVDKSTPSCGDSRFGCYVCTMVSQDKSMKAMIQNDQEKAWMQPIMDFRDSMLVMDDRHFRDFRRMNGQLILMNGRLVHGPYSQERRAELLRQLLITQQTVQRRGANQGAGQIALIPLEEMQEIRRIWIEEKGEIEDLLPRIYEEVLGTPYPGREIDPMPLDHNDLTLLRQVVVSWTVDNLPSDGAEPGATSDERSSELYKLTRTLLATSFKGLQSRKRSKQLDEIESVLSAFAFADEQDALKFAEEHLSSDTSTANTVDVAEAIDLLGEESGSDRKIIPIASEMSPLA